MVQHHKGAVDMAKTEVDKGKNTDAVAMAKSIVSSQTRADHPDAGHARVPLNPGWVAAGSPLPAAAHDRLHPLPDSRSVTPCLATTTSLEPVRAQQHTRPPPFPHP